MLSVGRTPAPPPAPAAAATKHAAAAPSAIRKTHHTRRPLRAAPAPSQWRQGPGARADPAARRPGGPSPYAAIPVPSLRRAGPAPASRQASGARRGPSPTPAMPCRRARRSPCAAELTVALTGRRPHARTRPSTPHSLAAQRGTQSQSPVCKPPLPFAITVFWRGLGSALRSKAAAPAGWGRAGAGAAPGARAGRLPAPAPPRSRPQLGNHQLHTRCGTDGSGPPGAMTASRPAYSAR
jgi:hypothetical protein